MKKRLVLLLVTAMAATTVLTGCGSKDSGSSDSGKKSAKESKVENDDDTLIVGFDASFPPYGYKDDSGEYVGFDLDLAQEVCDRNDWKLVKQPIDWDSKDAELNSETIDCIWNGFTMNGREDDYTWSDPYIDNKQVVVVRSDSGIDDFSGLKGKTLLHLRLWKEIRRTWRQPSQILIRLQNTIQHSWIWNPVHVMQSLWTSELQTIR